MEKTNSEIIQEEVDEHRGELVYDVPFSVVKLLGWTDQYEEDYYYIVYHRNGLCLYSCVGGFFWLKYRLTEKEYQRALEVFNMNIPNDEEIEKMMQNKGIILK